MSVPLKGQKVFPLELKEREESSLRSLPGALLSFSSESFRSRQKEQERKKAIFCYEVSLSLSSLFIHCLLNRVTSPKFFTHSMMEEKKKSKVKETFSETKERGKIRQISFLKKRRKGITLWHLTKIEKEGMR